MDRFRQACRGRAGGPRGFTILELLIVLSMSVLILGLAGFFVAGQMPGPRLHAAGREIAAAIRYARTTAQATGERQAVVFDLDARSYRLEGRGSKELPSDVGWKAVDPLKGDIQNGSFRISADPSGRMDAGSVVLWNRSRTVTIQVNPVLGPVLEIG